jgi:tetratricopeptide (TPR) repeat protein
MASLIPEYEYDIFISYRQKDNKGDRWVSEFVEALKTELESTFKEDINLYFDINPHDGLLETHDVDASLKEKLKCLIFIPIISRTYCDPKSFAWEHEFRIFVEQASHDNFGLKVKLPNGNVASRVLPVRIHALDSEDNRLFESMTGSFIRGIEFIYREPGVNKPLTDYDNENKNLNNTKYQIQINKVANAVQEIIIGMKAGLTNPAREKDDHSDPLEGADKEGRKKVKKRAAKLSRNLLSGVVILAILIIGALFAIPRVFKPDKFEELRLSGKISVAVMPFQNLTNDTTKNFWQGIIQDNLIYSLSGSNELNVKQYESVFTLLKNNSTPNSASMSLSIARSISHKLNTNVFIHGSITQLGTTLRLNAILVDTKTEEVIKSFQIDATSENILFTTDSLSRLVKDFLLITKLQKEVPVSLLTNVFTNSLEAYRNYFTGRNAFLKRDFRMAAKYFLQAFEIDSNFIEAERQISYSYLWEGMYEQSKIWCRRVYNRKDQMSVHDKILTERLYAYLFGTPYEVIKFTKQILELDDQLPDAHYIIGFNYELVHQYDHAIPELEKALEIYNKWNIKPQWINNYYFLGRCYHKTDQIRKEKNIYKKAEKDFPNSSRLFYAQAILALSERDQDNANKYIEKYLSVLRENSTSEAGITSAVAEIYNEANIPDKAEEYYRKALSFEPENPVRINSLAYFLVNRNRNIAEGLELADRALGFIPDDYTFLDCKGWGLYKQGKNKEALEILNKSWNLRMKNAIYWHEGFLHLEETRKAIARFAGYSIYGPFENSE